MTLDERLAALRTAGDADTGDAAWAALADLARRMEDGGRHRDDPVRAIFGLLGDRWSMLILLTLGTGEWRHATLRRIVGTLSIEGGISQRMLTLKLRTMEYDGLVHRTVGEGVPPRVSYRLTELGAGLLGQAVLLLNWVDDHRGAIEEGRRRFTVRAESER